MIQFKTKIHLVNAKFATKKNMANIFAVSSKICKNVIRKGIDNNTYKEKWSIRKEKQGYIFREITHHGGMNGYHNSIRSLVLYTANMAGHISVIYEG